VISFNYEASVDERSYVFTYFMSGEPWQIQAGPCKNSLKQMGGPPARSCGMEAEDKKAVLVPHCSAESGKLYTCYRGPLSPATISRTICALPTYQSFRCCIAGMSEIADAIITARENLSHMWWTCGCTRCIGRYQLVQGIRKQGIYIAPHAEISTSLKTRAELSCTLVASK
jgi:hypothetical protein